MLIFRISKSVSGVINDKRKIMTVKTMINRKWPKFLDDIIQV